MTVEIQELTPTIYDKPKVRITSEKFNHYFEVSKSNDGFVFYTVNVSRGQVPEKLKSRFTRMEEGVKAVVDYINKSPESKTVRRDKFAKEREERNAAKSEGSNG